MIQLYVFVTSSYVVGFIFVISHLQLCSLYCSYVNCHLISVDLQSLIRITFLCLFIHDSCQQTINIIEKSEFLSR